MFKIQQKLAKEAIGLVAQECGIDATQIINSSCRRAADARFVLISVLSQYLNDSEIGAILKRTRQGICFIRNNRCKAREPVLTASIRQVSSKLISWIADNE